MTRRPSSSETWGAPDARQLSPLPSQRWLRISYVCAEDLSRDAADYVWRLLDGLEAALYHRLDGPAWLHRAGLKHLSVALQFYGHGEPPAAVVESFRGWYSIDIPVHLPTVLELPLPRLTEVMSHRVLDALASPAVVAALGRPPLRWDRGRLPE